MNIKLRKLVAATVAGTALMCFGINAMADGTFDLIQALIAKGVLTEEEGLALMKSTENDKQNTKKNTISTNFKDGLVFESGDKNVSMKIGGRMHGDYRYFDRDISSKTNTAGTTNAANESDTFDIRRARIELSGRFYDSYDFLVSADLASPSNGNTSSILDQAWFNVSYWREAQLRFGQFKAPMNLEKMTSSNNIDFQERSFDNQLAANEDRGVMLWGVPKDGYTYALAVTSGEGAKNRNDADPRVDKVEFVGRGTANFAEIMGNKNAVYHVGASASYTELSAATGNGYLSGTGAVRTEARGINFFNMPVINTANVNGIDKAIERTRYGVEGAFAYNQFKVQSEWIRNNFNGDTGTTAANKVGFDKDVDAWYLEALWLITGEHYADFYKEGAWGTIKPNANFDVYKEGSPGAWELGIRYSKFDASDFKNFTTQVAQNAANKNLGVTRITANTADAANTLEADSWTLGLKFIPTPNTRFMVNYIDTKFDTPILIGTKLKDEERAITARAQWNF
jgi:phosphate-selective porin OprO/OprP